MGKSGEARWAAVIRSRTKSQSSQEALTTAEAALTAPLGILQSRLEESTTGTRGQATQHGKNHKAGSIRDKHRPQRPRRREEGKRRAIRLGCSCRQRDGHRSRYASGK